MATRRSTRKTARRRLATTLDRSHYRRSLRYEPLEDRRLLAVVTVDTDQDVVDFNDGVLSLREAIFATNVVPGPDTIQFAPALTAAGPATILLTQGELEITDDLTIEGPGASLLTIDASGSHALPSGSGVFTVDDGDAATLIDVVITGLALTGSNRSSPGGGGAVHNRENLSLDHMAITGNTSSSGIASWGSIHVSHSTITGNSGGFWGGGIFLSVGGEKTAIIVDCVISGNEAIYGGGIYASVSDGGTLEITGSDISENRAGTEDHYCPANAGMLFTNLNDFNELC